MKWLRLLLLVAIVLWVILRAVILTFSWCGDQSPERNAKIQAHFTSEDIAKGITYHRNGFWARAVFPYLKVAFLLALAFSGVFQRWADFIAEKVGGGFWVASIFQIVSLYLLILLINFPYSLYVGYFGEKKMGFSTLDLSGWLWRYVKSVGIGIFIQTGGILLLLSLIKYFPRGWVILTPLGGTTFGITITLLVPVIITPLFYTQTPVADGPLRDRILEISEKAVVPVKGVFQIDESKYSRHTNAYFTGLFSQKRIVLYDTLIKNSTVEEAALIFAHEVGHWQHDHVRKGLTLAFLGGFALSLFIWALYPVCIKIPEFHLRELWHPGNLPLFFAFMSIFQLFLAPIEAQISQHFERQADYASLELTGNTKAFIEAEQGLARDNQTSLLPHPFLVFWLYSHPPTIDRIAMAESYSPSQGKLE